MDGPQQSRLQKLTQPLIEGNIISHIVWCPFMGSEAAYIGRLQSPWCHRKAGGAHWVKMSRSCWSHLSSYKMKNCLLVATNLEKTQGLPIGICLTVSF